MCLAFYKTNNVFFAEEILNINNVPCEIIPTPVQDKAYCGICLKVSDWNETIVNQLLSDLDFKIIEE